MEKNRKSYTKDRDNSNNLLEALTVPQRIKNWFKRIYHNIKRYRNFILVAIDIGVIAFSYLISQILVTEGMPYAVLRSGRMLAAIIGGVAIYLISFKAFRLYKNITRYENGNDYLKYVLACLIAYSVILAISFIFPRYMVEPRVSMVAALLIVVFCISYRVVIRFVLSGGYKKDIPNAVKKRVLLIGAGNTTTNILKVLQTSLKGAYEVVGIIDDNLNKVNHQILGVPVVGTRYDIPRVVREQKVDGIFFCITNISNKEKSNILNICKETNCKVRVLPATDELIVKENIMSSFRDVEIEDLLGREQIKLDNSDIQKYIENQVVLVTGGGGSIGSELCRQIIKYNPSKLVIVDIYENNLYEIEQELRINYPDNKNVYAIVASVRDKKRLDEIFEEYKPSLVFHAAAHKHVPLMEFSPLEAIKNNVFGTLNTVNAADEYGVNKFVLISTDKAVNPTNIMGASKRLCEMIIQAKSKVSKTKYAAVRFGNVLGSNGSVIPLFKKQISKGGPVTVTHREITRFFMTIPEAVSLVLQSMTYANDGEIFVLDMGEPVKIYDMAVNLIKLSGYEPGVDIEIKFTGLRPGEKLYEELLMAEEGLMGTEHDKIFVAPPSDLTMDIVDKKLNKLDKLLKKSTNKDIDEIKKTFKEVVPTYKDNALVNKLKLKENENKNDKVVYINQKRNLG